MMEWIVAEAVRKAGISDKTYYYWRESFGGMARPQLSEMKALKKDNEHLKKIVPDLQLDQIILKEKNDYQNRPLWPTGRETTKYSPISCSKE